MSGSHVPSPGGPISPLRIQRVTLTDFRAFPGPDPVPFELDGKNLLVYGENGAGKSSLFHALQDFFSLQPKRTLAEHKNVFSDAPPADCKVIIEFNDLSGSPAAWTQSQHPAGLNKWYAEDYIHKFSNTSDQRVVEAARRVACLDYKSLLDTNYKYASNDINWFDLVVSSLLRDFRLTIAGGKESTLGDLWRAVRRAETEALRGKRTEKKEQKIRDACAAFNPALRSALDGLLPKANDVIRELGWSDIVLHQLRSPGVTYKTAHFRNDRELNGMELYPEISFRGRPLDKPHIFLNEARLSGLALALYLGGRLACVPAVDTRALKLLVLDDVLVGLDHSNRLPVLDVLASHFADWQVVLLTHDRTWFELTQSHVNEANWTCVEIYEGDAQSAAPQPIVRKTENRPARALLQKARELLKTPYLEAAANYTRQAFEHGVRKGCEIRKVPMRYTVNPAAHQAQDFLDALKIAPKPSSVSQTDWTGCLQQIEMFKNVVMNPYSHPSAPNIPKQEIEQAADAVEKFLELVGRK